MTPGFKLFRYAFGGDVIFLLVMCFLHEVALVFSMMIYLEGMSKLLHLNDMTRMDGIFSYRHHKFDHGRY